jgi:rubrerythrin
MYSIPAGAPADMYQAFAYIGTVSRPSVSDLQLMVLLESAGKVMYDGMAASSGDERIKVLLGACADEELLHAQRVSEALSIMGVSYPVPAPAENPYLLGLQPPTLTLDLVKHLAKAEFGGEDMYGGWANRCAHPAAAALFRLNGAEETRHGERLEQVAALMEEADDGA